MRTDIVHRTVRRGLAFAAFLLHRRADTVSEDLETRPITPREEHMTRPRTALGAIFAALEDDGRAGGFR